MGLGCGWAVRHLRPALRLRWAEKKTGAPRMMMGCVRMVVLELGNGPETKTTMLLLNADRCWLKKKKEC